MNKKLSKILYTGMAVVLSILPALSVSASDPKVSKYKGSQLPEYLQAYVFQYLGLRYYFDEDWRGKEDYLNFILVNSKAENAAKKSLVCFIPNPTEKELAMFPNAKTIILDVEARLFDEKWENGLKELCKKFDDIWVRGGCGKHIKRNYHCFELLSRDIEFSRAQELDWKSLKEHELELKHEYKSEKERELYADAWESMKERYSCRCEWEFKLKRECKLAEERKRERKLEKERKEQLELSDKELIEKLILDVWRKECKRKKIENIRLNSQDAVCPALNPTKEELAMFPNAKIIILDLSDECFEKKWEKGLKELCKVMEIRVVGYEKLNKKDRIRWVTEIIFLAIGSIDQIENSDLGQLMNRILV